MFIGATGFRGARRGAGFGIAGVWAFIKWGGAVGAGCSGWGQYY